MVVVTRKYQTTIPEDVRKELGLEIGNEIVFVKGSDGRYELMRVEELTEEVCETCKNIEETIEETRKGLGKGIKK